MKLNGSGRNSRSATRSFEWLKEVQVCLRSAQGHLPLLRVQSEPHLGSRKPSL